MGIHSESIGKRRRSSSVFGFTSLGGSGGGGGGGCLATARSWFGSWGRATTLPPLLFAARFGFGFRGWGFPRCCCCFLLLGGFVGVSRALLQLGFLVLVIQWSLWGLESRPPAEIVRHDEGWSCGSGSGKENAPFFMHRWVFRFLDEAFVGDIPFSSHVWFKDPLSKQSANLCSIFKG